MNTRAPTTTASLKYFSKTLATPCADYRAEIVRVRVGNAPNTTFWATVLSPKGKIYHVQLEFADPNTLTNATCDCPSQQYEHYSRLSGVPACKHIVALLHALSENSGRAEQYWLPQLRARAKPKRKRA